MKRFVKQFIEPLTDIAQIDEEILQEVIKMGFDRNQLIESLRNRMQNEVWTLIDLLKLVLYTILRYGLITYHAFFRLLLLTICYWTIDFVFPMAILELSSKKLWCVWFPKSTLEKKKMFPHCILCIGSHIESIMIF